MKWKAGMALLMVLSLAGCGTAANNAGNAAGMAGNAVGNTVRGTGQAMRNTGNALGNAAGQAGNAVGNATRWGANRVGDMANGPDYNAGTQSVMFHPTTRTVDIRLGGTNVPANTRGGTVAGGAVAGGTVAGGTVAGNVRGANVAGNGNTASTITVPLGWKIKVTSPDGAGWANNVRIASYRGTDINRAGTNFRPGAALAGGQLLPNGHTYTANSQGLYAIVVSGNGYTNRLVDFVNVTGRATAPGIATSHAW